MTYLDPGGGGEEGGGVGLLQLSSRAKSISFLVGGGTKHRN